MAGIEKTIKVYFDKMWLRAYISVFGCKACSTTIDKMILSGDSDMVTHGLATLSKPNVSTVILTETTATEWADYRIDLLAQRINATTNSTGFTVLENNCPNCDSKLSLTKSHGLLEYLSREGKIIVLDDYEANNRDDILNTLKRYRLSGMQRIKSDISQFLNQDRVILHCINRGYLTLMRNKIAEQYEIKISDLGLQKLSLNQP